MKKTSLHDKHISLNAHMTAFAGFDMPLFYDSISKEHHYVRNEVGIFDVSHMGNIIIEGVDARPYVNHIVTNNISDQYGKVTYGLILNKAGYVIDDVLVYSFSKHYFMIVCNASNIDVVYNWMKENQKNYQVTLNNHSNSMSQVAIQGPLSASIIQKIYGDGPLSLTFMTFQEWSKNQSIIISRTGYTGEDGFEIYGDHASIIALFDTCLSYGVYPIGLGARDTLRFEAALPLYGHELSTTIHPYEAGLGFAIKPSPFIGSIALEQLKKHTKRKLVGIKMLDRGIPRATYQIYSGDVIVGEITTGYQLPNKSYGLAFALIENPYHLIGTQLDVLIRNKKIPVEVIKKSFMQKNYKKES